MDNILGTYKRIAFLSSFNAQIGKEINTKAQY